MARATTIIVTLAALALIVLTVVTVRAQRTGGIEATVRDDAGKPVDDAVVSLMPVAGVATVGRPSATSAVMDQVDKEFVPHVLPVPVGTAVSFPNHDNIKHHVYSFSAPKKFELPLYAGTPASPVLFDKPGVVALGCNIHDWMVGYVLVIPTPYFAKTGADGLARLEEPPPGSYEARVWHPRMKGVTEKTAQTVTIPGTDAARLTWTLSLKREWRKPRGPGRYEGISG